jgi:hypothetical protein
MYSLLNNSRSFSTRVEPNMTTFICNKKKVAGRVIQARDPNRATEINLAYFPETWKIPVFDNRLVCLSHAEDYSNRSDKIKSL